MSFDGLTITRADLNNRGHGEAIVSLLDHYSRGQMAGGEPLARDTKQNLISRLQKQPGCVIYLAYDGDRPLGVCVCFVGFSTFKARPLLNVHDLAVYADARGRGVGGALLAAAEKEARRLECCKVTLEVRSDNDVAMGLYRKVGFGPSDPSAEAMFFWAKTLD